MEITRLNRLLFLDVEWANPQNKSICQIGMIIDELGQNERSIGSTAYSQGNYGVKVIKAKEKGIPVISEEKLFLAISQYN